jgi:NAD(P)H-hydrate repair Nnr-like enzyme with NAD(P)H-hydrate dehydratase domain
MRRDEIRARAYRLKAADEVGRRYRHAQVAAAIAAGLIAAGIVLLALAPKQNAAPRSSAATIMVHEFMVVR